MKSAFEFSRYKKFRNDADRALGSIYLDGHRRLADEERRVFTQWTQTAVTYLVMKSPKQHGINSLEMNLTQLNQLNAPIIASIIIATRKRSYNLSMAAETEAIGQLKGEATTAPKNIQHDNSIYGGTIVDRVKYYLDKQARLFVNAIQLGCIQELSGKEIILKAIASLPKQTKLPKNPRVLSKITEADRTNISQDSSLIFLDDEEWGDIVGAYKDEFVPEWRDPEDAYGGAKRWENPTGERVYAWDIEREMTEDFVKSVRDGQVEAMNQNGVKDMMWIAIVDDKTDECCLWRDGLLTSEIEAELDGKHSDDECDAIVPPAHPNCRCRIAPALDIPEDELPSNKMEFSEWLSAKGQ